MTAVTGVYRQLLKQSKKTFRGDTQALAAAWGEIRSHFLVNGSAPESEIPRLIADGREAAEFLRSGVLQGQLNDRGNYAVADLPDQDVVNILDPTQVNFKKPPAETKS